MIKLAKPPFMIAKAKGKKQEEEEAFPVYVPERPDVLTFAFLSGSYYVITEEKTGCSVVHDIDKCLTVKAARELLIKRLENINPAAWSAVVGYQEK